MGRGCFLLLGEDAGGVNGQKIAGLQYKSNLLTMASLFGGDALGFGIYQDKRGLRDVLVFNKII